MRKVPYFQWENIFLDTSILFCYLQATRENNTDQECSFVKRVIDDLNTNLSTNKKKRNFYVSAVSIAEMYDKSSDTKKTAKLVSKMNISTMTYVSFDTDIAEHMTSTYHSILGTEKLNKLSREIGYPQHDLKMVREWITRDLMILASADYLKCDTVMTVDDNTFIPLCKQIDYFGCSCKVGNFNSNDKYIFEYNG
jgi:hypothetical protein